VGPGKVSRDVGAREVSFGGAISSRKFYEEKEEIAVRKARPNIVHERPFVFTREGRWWLAKAPAIQGALTQGRSFAEARANLVSLIKDLEQIRF
jgi:hypothetical protein